MMATTSQQTSAYAESWLPAHIPSDRGRQVHVWAVEWVIVPKPGARLTAEVTTHELSTWLRGMLGEGKDESLVAKVKTVSSSMFQAAAEGGCRRRPMR